MKVVIEIPDFIYDTLIETGKYGFYRFDAKRAIKNGTALPKGHKIIDGYALQEHLALVPMEDRTYREAVEIIDWFPSIIESDTAESEE